MLNALFSLFLFLDHYYDPTYYEGHVFAWEGQVEFYREAEVTRFGCSYAVADHWYWYYDLLMDRYYDAVRADPDKENEAYRYWLSSCRAAWWDLKQSLDKTRTWKARLRSLRDLRESLGKFSIGDVLHWYDRGWMPSISER